MKLIDFTFGDAAAVARDTCARFNIFDSVTTCRILAKVLKRYGYEHIVPLSVKVLVFNPYVTKEFKPGDSPSNKRLHSLLENKKGHSVGLGMENSEDWQGHLVLKVNNSDGAWLVDPTLNMANRPKHNISLLPIGIQVEEDFGNFDGGRAIFKLNDCAVIYSVFPSDIGYEELTTWSGDIEEFDIDNIANQIFERLAFG